MRVYVEGGVCERIALQMQIFKMSPIGLLGFGSIRRGACARTGIAYLFLA